MCSNWIIDGKWCETGAELIAAVGIDTARKVNAFYGVDFDFIPDEEVAVACLCGVDTGKMLEETGVAYEYDIEADAFVPRTLSIGDPR